MTWRVQNKPNLILTSASNKAEHTSFRSELRTSSLITVALLRLWRAFVIFLPSSANTIFWANQDLCKVRQYAIIQCYVLVYRLYRFFILSHTESASVSVSVVRIYASHTLPLMSSSLYSNRLRYTITLIKLTSEGTIRCKYSMIINLLSMNKGKDIISRFLLITFWWSPSSSKD